LDIHGIVVARKNATFKKTAQMVPYNKGAYLKKVKRLRTFMHKMKKR
jgi:hypothetical protein